MSEMNEKADESQEQESYRPALRDVSPDELAKILEAHRKWVESEGKEGKMANLSLANLQGANLFDANLQGANLRAARLQGADLGGAKGLIASQVNIAKNWELAFYSLGLVFELELPRDHNEKVKKKLAELEKEKKATGAK